MGPDDVMMMKDDITKTVQSVSSNSVQMTMFTALGLFVKKTKTKAKTYEQKLDQS